MCEVSPPSRRPQCLALGRPGTRDCRCGDRPEKHQLSYKVKEWVWVKAECSGCSQEAQPLLLEGAQRLFKRG